MVDISWPTSSNPGGAPGEGSGRVINAYAYKDGGAPRWKPVPGLDDFSALPVTDESRGAIVYLGVIFVVASSKVLQVDSTGAPTVLEGQVSGAGPVTLARNNKAPSPDVVIVTDSGPYVVESGIVSPYPDSNLPTTVNSVTILDGFLLFTTPDAQIWASDLNATSVNALSFATAEARPDGLLRGVVYGQQFFAMGQETIEVYQDAGTIPFPLARSTVIPIGLIGQWAVAGFEDGWAGPLIFVAQDGSVRSLDGYTPDRISEDDLEALIAAVPDKSTLRAAVHTHGGNSIWVLSSPTWTWQYNVTTQQWNERISYRQERWRGDVSIKAFDKWIISELAGGKLYALNAATRTEDAQPLIWGLDSGPVKQFPSRIQVPGAAFDFVLGQTGPTGNPQVMISWSHDGGATWSNPITRSIGLQGRERGRVSVNRIGLTSPAGIRWRLRVSDPAYSSFAGGRMDAADRK